MDTAETEILAFFLHVFFILFKSCIQITHNAT